MGLTFCEVSKNYELRVCCAHESCKDCFPSSRSVTRAHRRAQVAPARCKDNSDINITSSNH